MHSAGQLTDEQLTEDLLGTVDTALGCFTEEWNDLTLGGKIGFVLILVAAGAVLTLEILLDIFGGAGTGI